jgi:hypothetical protein
MPIVSVPCPVFAHSNPNTYQANKLSTVKKVLNEVLRYGGPFHPRELYPVGFTHLW